MGKQKSNDEVRDMGSTYAEVHIRFAGARGVTP